MADVETAPEETVGRREPYWEPAELQPERRSRARSLAWLIALAALAGAIVGAATHADPADRHVAEAVIAIQPDPASSAGGPGRNVARWRTLADTARLPAVVRDAQRQSRALGSLDEVRGRITVAGSPGGSLVRIRARDRSPGSATALADAVATSALAFLRAALRQGLEAPLVGTRFWGFEAGPEAWGTDVGVFSTPAIRSGPTGAVALEGERSLRLVCEQDAGCGSWVKVFGPFPAGRAWTGEVWARALGQPVRARLVLGATGGDVAVGEPLSLTREWARLTVTHVPAEAAPLLEMAVQTTSGGGTFFLDSASLSEPGHTTGSAEVEARARELAVEVRARRVAEEDRYTVLAAAAPVGEERAHTALWALAGALGGVLVVLAGLLAERVSRRRRGRQ